MQRHVLTGIAAMLLAAGGPIRAGEFVCPLMTEAPAIDGRIDAAEWSRAVRIDGFGMDGRLEQRRATAYIGATRTHLYCAVSSQLPDEGELVTECARDSENLVFDDSVEVWVDPWIGEERGARFQMLANSAGHAWYKMHAYGGMKEDPAWRGEWQVAGTTDGDAWQFEASVPLESIRAGLSATDHAIGVNLCRNWKQEWAFSSVSMGAYAPQDVFRFAEGAPIVPGFELRQDPFGGLVDAVLTLRNVSGGPAPADCSLVLTRDVMPELKQQAVVPVPAGEVIEYPLTVEDHSTRLFTLTGSVVANGQTVLSRGVAWPAKEPLRWVTHKREIAPVDFQFGYYPYLNRLRIRADVSNLPDDATLERLVATVRRTSGEEVASVAFDSLVNGRQEVPVDLPPLSGEYEIALRATGPNVPTAEVVKPFERKTFEWEHATLGRSRTVYPPFTPIEVDGDRVRTVLREHTMGGAGLWEQVSAAGRELLSSGMRLEGGVGGAAVQPSIRRHEFVETADDRAVCESEWSLGGVPARVLSTWDYDGMMRVDLTLQPSTSPIDSLSLVIPLRSDVATHYHAMGDGIRNTLYDVIPQGDGVVWTSELTHANDLPTRFCSYIYVGGPKRGLCWFAENDAGWSWDPSTPSVELARVGDAVEMRVHLINRPLTVTEPRTITFGLQAAPVKPRLPDDWRHIYRRENYSLLGTDVNWLALGDCGSVYPAGRDMYLWEMIARGNREELSDADIQAVIDRGKPYFEPYGEDRVNTFIAHARYNLRARLNTKMIFYYNRASYQSAEEFETFKDEWGLSDLRSIDKGNGIWEIKIVPTESYIDHALYWYDKSFDIGGNQGVYWDNWFFVGSYNTAMTGAYTRDDGSVVPSNGLWGLRELAKRTFILMNERGMRPVTMAHMTSTNILPLLSFCTVQYDWEWKYSEGDVQNRFTREYILLVSNGELAGTWPVLLNDHGAQAEDPWVPRTFAAVAMVHELDCPYPPWSEAGKQQLALFAPVDAILAKPGVRAFRYWDDDLPPVVADSPDLPTIVYSVPGEEAVFAVVSYADQDRTAELSINAQALGLADGYEVTNCETGDVVPVRDGRVSVPLRSHDVAVLRAAPQ